MSFSQEIKDAIAGYQYSRQMYATQLRAQLAAEQQKNKNDLTTAQIDWLKARAAKAAGGGKGTGADAGLVAAMRLAGVPLTAKGQPNVRAPAAPQVINPDDGASIALTPADADPAATMGDVDTGQTDPTTDGSENYDFKTYATGGMVQKAATGAPVVAPPRLGFSDDVVTPGADPAQAAPMTMGIPATPQGSTAPAPAPAPAPAQPAIAATPAEAVEPAPADPGAADDPAAVAAIQKGAHAALKAAAPEILSGKATNAPGSLKAMQDYITQIDPNGEIPGYMKTTVALAHAYHTLQDAGYPDAAQKVAVKLAVSMQDTTKALGALAQHAAEKGDNASAAALIGDAVKQFPSAHDLQFKYDPKVGMTYTLSENGEVKAQGVANADMLMQSALGLKDGSLFRSEIERIAGVNDKSEAIPHGAKGANAADHVGEVFDPRNAPPNYQRTTVAPSGGLVKDAKGNVIGAAGGSPPREIAGTPGGAGIPAKPAMSNPSEGPSDSRYARGDQSYGISPQAQAAADPMQAGGMAPSIVANTSGGKATKPGDVTMVPMLDSTGAPILDAAGKPRLTSVVGPNQGGAASPVPLQNQISPHATVRGLRQINPDELKAAQAAVARGIAPEKVIAALREAGVGVGGL